MVIVSLTTRVCVAWQRPKRQPHAPRGAGDGGRPAPPPATATFVSWGAFLGGVSWGDIEAGLIRLALGRT